MGLLMDPNFWKIILLVVGVAFFLALCEDSLR